MPDPICITTSLAGHILLDPELCGRFGVQGNTFKNTFGYLNQYFKTLKYLPPQLEKLSLSMQALVERADVIIRLNSSNATTPSLTDVTEHAALQILDLKEGEDFMVPGGWMGAGGGHAMIYHFQKTDDGELLFSIYNAGAGLEHHEKLSTTTNEHYFPVLSYKIALSTLKENAEKKELSILLQRLILPQLPAHPLRNQKKFDAEILYQDIEKSMIALKAVHQAQVNTAITTGGQISGTCSQRSIHQMLKVNFDTLPEYQRFIFDFKLYALNDFIATHTPCSPRIADFIHEAIKNNLKILQEPNVFNSKDEQDAVVNQLVQLQQDMLNKPHAIKSSSLAIEQPLVNYDFKLNTQKKTKFDDPCALKQTNIHSHPTLPTSLLEKMDALIHLQDDLNEQDPLWILEQIEQTILHLPLPNKPVQRDKNGMLVTFYEVIPPYDQINTPNQLQEMGTKLERLQDMYTKVSQQLLVKAQLPHQLVTQCSLLALRDYVDVQLAQQQIKPSFNGAINESLARFLDGFRNCPFVATNDPDFDQRVRELMHLYKLEYTSKADDDYYIKYYSAVLDTEPKLKEELQRLYTNDFATDQSGLHVTLCIERLTELYYLFEQMGTLEKLEHLKRNSSQDFDVLIKKMQQQVCLEKFFVSCFNPFLYSPNRIDYPLQLDILSEKDRIIKIKTPGNTSDIRRGTFSIPTTANDITRHKYNLSPSKALYALLKDYTPKYFFQTKPGKLPGNSIQLSSNDDQLERSITKEDFYTRELLHLRSSPANQIDFTLDYFKASLNKLSDPNIQRYMEANIFEPGLLCDMLDADLRANKTTFLDRFDDFIKKGEQYFTNPEGMLGVESIFFIRLRFYLNRYVARYNEADIYTERSTKDQHHLNALIQSETDPSMLERVHTYRFLTVIARYELKPEEMSVDGKVFELAFYSYCFIQAKNNPNIDDDTASRFERTRAEHHFKTWLQHVPSETIKPLIKPMVESIGLEIADFNLTGTHPTFILESMDKSSAYIVNTELGRVFKDGSSLSGVPLNIQHHPMTRRLGLSHETSCFLSPDAKTLEFTTINPAIRMKWEGMRLIIQKEWTINGKKDWYELQPLTRKQEQLFNLGKKWYSMLNEHLPKILTDGSTELWVNGNRSGSIISQNNRPVYQVNEHFQLEQLNSDGLYTGYVIANAQGIWQRDLARFESPDFFSVKLDKKNTGTVDFVRYGLSLTIEGNQITLPETNYRLSSAEHSPFGKEIAVLNFTDGVNQQCIVAVQPFYRQHDAANEKGDYYQLKHDTSGHIPTEILKKRWEEASLAEKDQPMWHYADSAKTIMYKLVNGMPKPDTAADALYLCYLYLAQHEIDKAWAVLDEIKQLEGTMDELTYLSWITNALPVVLEDNDADATLKTPRYIACQLKALACYTDFLAQDKKTAIPNDAGIDMTKANGHYEAFCLNQNSSFYNNLPSTIHDLYSQLQNIGPHLDEMYSLQLDDFACKRLLNYYDPSTTSEDEPKALGSLGYEQRRLSLKTLVLEYNQLIAIQHASPEYFQPKFNKRMASIENQLKQHLDVMKKSTIIQAVSIDLSLPHSMTINESLLPKRHSAARTSYEVWRNNVFDTKLAGTPQQAMNALSSAINEDFILYFPHYIKIATDVNSPERATLLEHCEIYLKGCRHIPLNKHDTNVPYLTNCLYRVFHNPNCLKSYTQYGISPGFGNAGPRIEQCQFPPIEVYQAEDVFHDVLATSHEIWEELKQNMPGYTPMKPVTFNQLIPYTMSALIERSAAILPASFNECCMAYLDAESSYQIKLKALLTTIDAQADPRLRGNDSAHVLAEKLAGDLKYTCVQKQREIAENMLGCHETCVTLKKNASEIDADLDIIRQENWQNALDLANQTPTDSDLARSYAIKLAAKQRNKVTDKELLKLYLRADRANYIERTGLSPEKSDELHAMIHQVVSVEVQQQHVKRLLSALTPLTGDTPDLAQIASILMSENHANAKNDPALMVFQYEENILLRPRQIEALMHLLSNPQPDDAYQFKNAVEKVIMGGGKSKVILPILAAKKAMGLNLVVIEVPRALLATNHVDLNSTSKRLFNQKAHRFEFDRDSDCSPRRLEAIYQQFVDTMTNKDYLVTTGESIQSLELKYLDLLLSRPEQDHEIKQWKKQVYWAGKITALLKQSGDVVIDELHQGLLLKKKLNYTLGIQQAINHKFIQYSSNLYQFVDTLALESVQDPHTTINERMEHHWPQTIDHLAIDLIYHPKSPLTSHIKNLKNQYGEDVLPNLLAFLTNKAEASEIIAADASLKEAFAFYKEQLSLLPQTLSRHHKEHYGPSKLESHSALKRALAIPYAANDKPNERSRFGNPLETINYTIQSMLNDGLNKELLIEIIEQWQLDARNELKKNSQYQYLDQTPTALGVAIYLEGTGKKNKGGGDLSLKTLNPRNETHMSILLEHLQHNKALLFSLLETQILKQITVEPAILHSDAYNHVDIYHSCQGLSGTPWNHSTFHQNLQYNHSTSLGTDGYIQQVLKEKKTPIHTIQFANIENFLHQLHTKISSNKQVRAIIDISATFAGLSNLGVAKELAAFSSKHKQTIRYILYFNEDDILCALDVARPMRPPIVLASSDPVEIDRKLNCQPVDRLTYYDQSHTIGTDLKQGISSCGIVLVNEKTHLQSFLQGSMRMRGLDEHQTVEIIVPDSLHGISFDDLMMTMASNEHKQLCEDNYVAAIAKMENIVRLDLLMRIANLDEHDIETRYKWAQAFKRYFIETKNFSLFEQYGGISHKEDTKVLLDKHLDYLIEDCLPIGLSHNLCFARDCRI